VLYTEHFDDGAALYEAVGALGLEGVVSKRADAPYCSGRTESWLKIKCLRRERFVVVGFAPEDGGGLAKLRLARFEIRRALAPLKRTTCPLVRPIRRADTIWLEPATRPRSRTP
jgi:hypothetical protein